MEHDFIVGFTIFYPGGFKTRYQHFDDLKVAKMKNEIDERTFK